jgi:hypothetical protein
VKETTGETNVDILTSNDEDDSINEDDATNTNKNNIISNEEIEEFK